MSSEQEDPLNLLNKSKFSENRALQKQEEENKTTRKMTNEDERQLALANLFSSLSSLAASSRQQQVGGIGELTRAQHPFSISGDSAASDSQTAMASMLHQHQHQQNLINKQAFLACDPINLYANEQQQDLLYTLSNQQQQQQQQQTQQQQQRINYCTICNKELCNKYFMKTHMLKMHGINLEMEQPDSSSSSGSSSVHEVDHNELDEELNEQLCSPAASDQPLEASNSQDQPKGLISSSSSSSASAGNCGGKKQQSGSCKSSSRAEQQQQQQQQVKKSSQSQAGNKKQQVVTATSVMNGFAGNSMGGVVCDICNKELCSKYFLKVHKQNTHGIMTDQDVSGCHQFMYNPFVAPNPFTAPHLSAGGPIPVPVSLTASDVVGMSQAFPPAPLFNGQKALAPQTQQQSAGKPAPQPIQLAQQQQVDLTLNAQQLGASASRNCANGKRLSSEQGSAKRARLGNNIDSTALNYLPQVSKLEADESATGDKQQFESIYRLILAQQQQQQQQQHRQINPLVADSRLNPNSNPVALSALMCFGAANTAGSFLGGQAGHHPMSPAMIVESILRNQHLFNRSKPQAQNQLQVTTDRNNNSISSSCLATQKGSNSKSSSQKDPSSSTAGNSSASNSRYFSHYTEACPMCDRRFKSIKWLKTHMMNDHKQEISAYMQMMMQYFYASKSQQMVAVAAMAAFEQQQQQQQQQHYFAQQQHQQAMKNHPDFMQPLTLTQQHLQQPQANSLQFQANNNKCLASNDLVSPLNQHHMKTHPHLKSDLINEQQQQQQQQNNINAHQPDQLQFKKSFFQHQREMPSSLLSVRTGTSSLVEGENFIIDARLQAHTEGVPLNEIENENETTTLQLSSSSPVSPPASRAAQLHLNFNCASTHDHQFFSSSSSALNQQLSSSDVNFTTDIGPSSPFALSQLNGTGARRDLIESEEVDSEDEDDEEDEDEDSNQRQEKAQQQQSNTQIKTTSS